MIIFTELLERAKSELIAIHTPTEAQAKTLLKALDEKGYIWINGGELTTETRYGNYKENTCYDFAFDFRRILNKKVCVSPLVWFPKHDYTIIAFTDIDFSEKTN